jgi:hypothetical protein
MLHHRAHDMIALGIQCETMSTPQVAHLDNSSLDTHEHNTDPPQIK